MGCIYIYIGIPEKMKTTQIKKRHLMQLCNLTNDSKSFYVYVRSKQNIRDKVGSLEDSAGNIISQVFFNGGRPKWILQLSVYQRGYLFITSSRC